MIFRCKQYEEAYSILDASICIPHRQGGATRVIGLLKAYRDPLCPGHVAGIRARNTGNSRSDLSKSLSSTGVLLTLKMPLMDARQTQKSYDQVVTTTRVQTAGGMDFYIITSAQYLL